MGFGSCFATWVGTWTAVAWGTDLEITPVFGWSKFWEKDGVFDWAGIWGCADVCDNAGFWLFFCLILLSWSSLASFALLF